ncbi:MAG: phosphoribosylformylglycinamidine synthase [Rickettsiales bacterium]|jgi:phosphoribosylformylglycinamidine synthase|nr:phosphoribosylformylglycinamidine synthase [Rickettsiales bacterium]
MPRSIHFFQSQTDYRKIYAVEIENDFNSEEVRRMEWLTGGKELLEKSVKLHKPFVGTIKERQTPQSSSSTEIAAGIGLEKIGRFEEYALADSDNPEYDIMLQEVYSALDQGIFTTDRKAELQKPVEDIEKFGKTHGLAFSKDEVAYLEGLAKEYGRDLTDAEVYCFAQANSEHCRHKIFNAEWEIDGEKQPSTLFSMIKETTLDPNSPTGYKGLVTNAYKDNAAAFKGFHMMQWVNDVLGNAVKKETDANIIAKAETHNHPTAVSPEPGAATGSGGEIRDRICVGTGSHPLSGTLAIMTNNLDCEWEPLFSSPAKILIEGTNGAARFCNEYGQPNVNFRALTFNYSEFINGKQINFGYGKPVLLAGGTGYVDEKDAQKDESLVEEGMVIVMLGGPNFLIGMGGGSAASVAGGTLDKKIDRSSVQRHNPEMQARCYRAVRSFKASGGEIVSIHDHGAGGHYNCFVELVEAKGGKIYIYKLPIGDPTLSPMQILANESQERFGLLLRKSQLELFMKCAKREVAPARDVGSITGDHRFVFENADGTRAVDMPLADILKNPPKTLMTDKRIKYDFAPVKYDDSRDFEKNLIKTLGMVSVGSTDWWTNKADRCVSGLVLQQQCVGELQLPICNYGITACDYETDAGTASTMGFAPIASLIDSKAGTRLAILDAILPLAFTPVRDGLESVILSANWMWPCGNEGENARLYDAVQETRDTCLALGVKVPTGKDSLSMTQTLKDKTRVMSPGTSVVSAWAVAEGIDKKVLPVMDTETDSFIVHLDMSGCPAALGGSAFAQSLGFVGNDAPDGQDMELFKKAFAAVQEALQKGLILAGNNISSGGLIAALLKMTFANTSGGIAIGPYTQDADISKKMFAENPGVVMQVARKDFPAFAETMRRHGVGRQCEPIAHPIRDRKLVIEQAGRNIEMDIDELRDAWHAPSARLEAFQNKCADERKKNIFKQPLVVNDAARKMKSVNIINPSARKTTCAVIREKGVNGEIEMQRAAELGGFDRVLDITMTDLMDGTKDFSGVNAIIFAGGFSNADALGAGKGWAAKFRFDGPAHDALVNFFNRGDTLAYGVCNGCQAMLELWDLFGGGAPAPMQRNDSGKFESSCVSVIIPDNTSAIFGPLAGVANPIHVNNGEGKFKLDHLREGVDYQVVMKCLEKEYPGNFSGNPDGIVGIASPDGRANATMPHPERGVLKRQLFYGKAETWMPVFINMHNYFTK